MKRINLLGALLLTLAFVTPQAFAQCNFITSPAAACSAGACAGIVTVGPSARTLRGLVLEATVNTTSVMLASGASFSITGMKSSMAVSPMIDWGCNTTPAGPFTATTSWDAADGLPVELLEFSVGE